MITVLKLLTLTLRTASSLDLRKEDLAFISKSRLTQAPQARTGLAAIAKWSRFHVIRTQNIFSTQNRLITIYWF